MPKRAVMSKWGTIETSHNGERSNKKTMQDALDVMFPIVNMTNKPPSHAETCSHVERGTIETSHNDKQFSIHKTIQDALDVMFPIVNMTNKHTT
jgi:hypothetical protein